MAPAPHEFSPQELRVLQLLSCGKSDKQVAKSLGLSDLTVRTYRTKLFKKANVSNICALLYRAYCEQWITWSESEPDD
ncbi:hypothetical protein GJ699_14405 [Duganella sp. FT80W]|uniref:HTH luxR-type domain-containing protein n=1 Tax=Duganella guangzhouensis TaxID=2666084 RepID=A0A6I2L2X9_9BURK|nr:hypothetical protein [Duganella guangzhouensis]